MTDASAGRTVAVVVGVVLSVLVAGVAPAAVAGPSSTRGGADPVAAGPSGGSPSIGAGTAAGATAVQPELPTSALTNQRGDVVRISIRMDGARRVSLRVFDRRGSYERRIDVADRNNDGRAVVTFNTYLAGEDRAFAAEGSDTVEVYGQPAVEGLLPASTYRLQLLRDGEAVDGADLTIEPRSTESLSAWVVPRDSIDGLERPADAEAYRSAGRLTRRSQNGTEGGVVAAGDGLVLALRASGLSGAIADSPGETSTERFRALAGSDTVDLEVTQQNPPADLAAARLLLNGSGVRVVADERSDVYYLVVDTEAAQFRRGSGEAQTGLEAGMVFDATFSVSPESKLADEEETVGERFEVVERRASLGAAHDQPEAGGYYLRRAADQVVAGTTTLAPGSAVTVTLAGGERGYDEARTVTVTDGDGRGEFRAAYDLSRVRERTVLEATVAGPAGRLEADARQITVRAPTAALDVTDTTVAGRTLFVRVNASLSRGGVLVARAPGDGWRRLGSVFVEPGTEEVAIPLSDPPGVGSQVVITAHRDLDDDRSFTPGADDPYTTRDRPVNATITLRQEPPTPTPSPTPTPGTPTATPVPGTPTDTPVFGTPTPGDTPTPSDPEGPEPPADLPVPGFGGVAALLALAGAAAALARRK